MNEIRLAGLLVPLSLVSDLGMGFAPEHSIRNCLLAMVVGREMGLAVEDLSDLYYTALLFDIGCTASAHEFAMFVGGDDVAMRGLSAVTDFADAKQSLAFMKQVGSGLRPGARTLTRMKAMASGSRAGRYFVRGTCEVGTRLVARLGLGPGTVRAIDQIFERWDGKGDPHGLEGESIALVARIVSATYLALSVHEVAGAEAAIAELRRCAGSSLDPQVVEVVAKGCNKMFAHFDETDPFAEAIDAEPRPIKIFPSTHLREVALAFTDLADLKTPHTAGHSRAVADLVTAAGSRGPGSDLELAALLRDLGRVGISNSIWSKPGPLTISEWESVRLHAYHSERIISKVPALSALAPLVGMHHERLDGSGYHRGSRGSEISLDVCLIAAADAYHSMIQDRPYRGAMTLGQAALALQEEVT
ncbi:MAG TPA: HD domain-containing phosphohydrolase, partial [Actinomycetota bacterium]|nr:HD domain-containing phosphohydrolase [Actinomycetota bacterium]